MLGFATGGRYLIPLEVSAACVLVGAGCAVAYLLHARRVEAPLLRLELLKIPTFRASVLGGSLFRVGVGAIPFLLPLLLQLGFGLNPLESGMLTFVAAIGAIFTKVIAKRVLERVGFRRLLTVNAFVGAAFIAANGFFAPDTPHWIILLVLFVGGCFRSLQFTSLNAIGYADITNPDPSYATSLSSAAQQLALSMGVAIGGFALQSAAQLRGSETLEAGDFAPAFWLVAGISALAGFVFARLDPSAGAEMSGHRTVNAQAPSTGLGDGLEGRPPSAR
jgi:predicted MFS family arabinose efflux permease